MILSFPDRLLQIPVTMSVMSLSLKKRWDEHEQSLHPKPLMAGSKALNFPATAHSKSSSVGTVTAQMTSVCGKR